MTRNTKLRLAVALLVLAFVVTIAGIVGWQHADDTASDDAITADFESAFGFGRRDTSPDHTASFVMFGVAALSALGGMIFLATLSPPDETAPTQPAADDDASDGWG